MKLLQFKRVGEGNGDGLIPRMRELLDAHSATLENIAGEDGIGVRKNWQGGITIYGKEAASLSIWSGIVFANGQPIKDFNRIGNDPEEANSEFGLYGMDGDVYAGSVTGEWLKVDRATGDCDFMDSDDEELFDDASDHEYFKVAERSGKDENGDWIYFPVSLRTCGDAHVFKGGALDVAGTPAMYKVVIILGWKKTSAEASWEQMTAAEVVSNPPTKLWDEFIPYDEETGEGDKYPWYAFRPTWDYPRTHA